MPYISEFYTLFRCAVKRRENGVHRIVLSILFICVFHNMLHKHSNGLLYVQNKFGWGVVEYTNWNSFSAAVFAYQAFVVTPFYSYYVRMHDCLVSALGNYAVGAYCLVIVRVWSIGGSHKKCPASLLLVQKEKLLNRAAY